MRALQAVTPVSWIAAGMTRHIYQFMLLGLQALALHCWMHSRRTVFSRHIRMYGLSMDTAESAALRDVSGTCNKEEAPLLIFRMVACGTRATEAERSSTAYRSRSTSAHPSTCSIQDVLPHRAVCCCSQVQL